MRPKILVNKNLQHHYVASLQFICYFHYANFFSNLYHYLKVCEKTLKKYFKKALTCTQKFNYLFFHVCV